MLSAHIHVFCQPCMVLLITALITRHTYRSSCFHSHRIYCCKSTGPDVPLHQNLWWTSLRFLEVIFLNILSFRRGAYGLWWKLKMTMSRLYFTDTQCIFSLLLSTLGVILHKVHKHGTHAAQTSYLFSVNDPHHQTHNGAQFPHLFLFFFPSHHILPANVISVM